MSLDSESTFVNPLHPSIKHKLDTQFAEIYNKYQAPKLQAHHVDFEIYDADRGTYTFSIAEGPRPDVGNNTIYKVPVTNPTGEIQVQVFTPTPEAVARAGSANSEGKLPCHVDIHGGGFVIGSLNSDASWCHVATQSLGAVVVNVDYRMAPAFPHPVPATDCYVALKWAIENASKLNIDTTRISIGGGSAGGNLAAVCCLMARDDPAVKHNLVLQLLLVPCIDARLWLGTDVEKHNKLANTPFASPIVAETHAGLAPAFICVAEIDPLASEGAAYHEKLTKAGTESRLKIYPGVGHPFAHWDGQLEAARVWVQDALGALSKAYGLKGTVGKVEYDP